MMVTYPRENPPDVVVVGGEEYDVDEGVVEVSRVGVVRTLARRWGVHPATIRTDQCGTPIKSGPRAGVPCDNSLPCSHHSGDES